jgi:hypothetical protein
MSRKSAEATLPVRQAFLTVSSNKCSESVVERPGLPPKCVLGSSWCFSKVKVSLYATTAVSNFPMVLSSAIGRYAFGIE